MKIKYGKYGKSCLPLLHSARPGENQGKQKLILQKHTTIVDRQVTESSSNTAHINIDHVIDYNKIMLLFRMG